MEYVRRSGIKIGSGTPKLAPGAFEGCFFASLNRTSSPVFGPGDVMRKYRSRTYPGVAAQPHASRTWRLHRETGPGKSLCRDAYRRRDSCSGNITAKAQAEAWGLPVPLPKAGPRKG